MIRRPPRSTLDRSSAASDVYKRQGQTITVEPWRAQAFPVLKDLTVDRSALDRIQQAGGYVSVNTGNAQDGNSLPIDKELADASFLSLIHISEPTRPY